MRNEKMLTGRWGEALAAEHLRKKGYEILGLNYRTRSGEIDMIARKGGFIAFIEVKTRRTSEFAEAKENVDGRKTRRIRNVASLWLSGKNIDLQPRFDVIEVYAPDGPGGGKAVVKHLENAF